MNFSAVVSDGSKRGSWNTIEHLEGVMADVVLRHLFAQERFADLAGLEAFAEHSKEECFLVRIRVDFVATEQAVVAE